ncbi:hypothetical protein BH23CHL5_BH23CHL5_27900 [soil metagenome]
MFRDNPIGVVILALCGVAGIVIIWQIITGERLRYNGPDWLAWILGIVIVGGSLYMIFEARIRGRDQQWPNPGAGRRSLWDRIRGKNDDS